VKEGYLMVARGVRTGLAACFVAHTTRIGTLAALFTPDVINVRSERSREKRSINSRATRGQPRSR
jgi:hypothetical protein